MAEPIVAPAPETPVPAIPDPPTICARCPNPAAPGENLCTHCIQTARYQDALESDLDRRCACEDWLDEGVRHDS